MANRKLVILVALLPIVPYVNSFKYQFLENPDFFQSGWGSRIARRYWLTGDLPENSHALYYGYIYTLCIILFICYMIVKIYLSVTCNYRVRGVYHVLHL